MTARSAWSRPSTYLGLLPAIGCIAAIATLSRLLPAERAAALVFDPPVLMLVLNTLLLFGISVVVSGVAMRAFLASGAPNLLLLGCGVLVLGSAALIGGWIRPLGGAPNASVTAHNLGVLAAAFLHALSALMTFLKVEPERVQGRRRRMLFLLLAGTMALIVFIAWAALSGWVPPFWVPGSGSTALKTGVLTTAVSLFALTALYTMILHLRTPPSFLYWYSLALALTAIGLVGIAVIKAVGDPIGWVGRAAQYAGGVYFLVAALSALSGARAEGFSFEEAIDRYYRLSDVHFRDLVETVGDAIISVDGARRILFWNRGAEKMLGYRRGEAAGCPVSELLMPAGQAARLDEELGDLARQLEDPIGTRQVELEMRRKDRTVFPAQASISMRRTESELTATLVVRDISMRKMMERRLRELNETLEVKVTERTAVAEQRARQLRALSMQLIEAEEKERRRIADLLHDDLQQLLTASRMQIDALGALLESDRRAQAISELVSEHLQEAIDKSRRLSHELSPAILQYRGLSGVIEWLAGRMVTQYGLKATVEPAQDWSDQAAEPFKVFFYNAAQELLLNVVKHGRTKEASVQLAREGKQLRLTVADQGCGFDPAALTLLMEGNAGRGLFRLKERAGFFGGELVIDVAPQRGSRIAVLIPLRDEGAPSARQVNPPDGALQANASAGIPPAAAAGYRVLIADDHQLVRQGLMAVLRGARGIQIVGEAATGGEAVELARQLEPDVVLMDVSMPGMDGIEATRRIHGEAPRVRIIGLSMHEEADMAAAMRQAGAEDYLSKVGSTDRLIAAICRSPGP